MRLGFAAFVNLAQHRSGLPCGIKIEILWSLRRNEIAQAVEHDAPTQHELRYVAVRKPSAAMARAAGLVNYRRRSKWDAILAGMARAGNRLDQVGAVIAW